MNKIYSRMPRYVLIVLLTLTSVMARAATASFANGTLTLTISDAFQPITLGSTANAYTADLNTGIWTSFPSGLFTGFSGTRLIIPKSFLATDSKFFLTNKSPNTPANSMNTIYFGNSIFTMNHSVEIELEKYPNQVAIQGNVTFSDSCYLKVITQGIFNCSGKLYMTDGNLEVYANDRGTPGNFSSSGINLYYPCEIRSTGKSKMTLVGKGSNPSGYTYASFDGIYFQGGLITVGPTSELEMVGYGATNTTASGTSSRGISMMNPASNSTLIGIISQGGKVTLTGYAAGRKDNQAGIYMTDGVYIKGTNGANIKMLGYGSKFATGTYPAGILISSPGFLPGSSVSTDSTGTIEMTGYAGPGGPNSKAFGITLGSDGYGTIPGTVYSNGSGKITIIGYSDSLSQGDNGGFGMFSKGAKVYSQNGGDIDIQGYSLSQVGRSVGVYLTSLSTIYLKNGGNLNIHGKGSDLCVDSNSHGIWVSGNSRIHNGNGLGNIELEGVAGSNPNSVGGNHGIYVNRSLSTDSVVIASYGSGTLSLKGKGGAGQNAGNGILLDSSRVFVQNYGGNLALTAESDTGIVHTGLVINKGSGILHKSSSDTLFIQCPSIRLDPQALIQQTAGMPFSIKSGLSQSSLVLGEDEGGGNGPLALSNSELYSLKGYSQLLLGDTSAGELVVKQTVRPKAPLVIQTGSQAKFRPQAIGKEFLLDSSTCQIQGPQSLGIRLQGNVADSTYDQWTTDSVVDLTSYSLALSGAYLSRKFDDFTIVQAGAVQGEFQGYPDSSLVPYGSSALRIRYTANSVILQDTQSRWVTPKVKLQYPSPLCKGSALTLSAVPTHPGSAPQFFWYKNAVLESSGSQTLYAPTSFANGDTFFVVMKTVQPYQTDSIAYSDTLTVAISDTNYTFQNKVICSNQLPFSWAGLNFTQAGVQVAHYVNQSGCDSTVEYSLSVNPVSLLDTQIVSCQPLSWHSRMLTQSGVYRDTLQNALGCDSLLVLHFDLRQATSSSDTVKACTSFTWNQHVLTQTGVYADTLQNAAGCDSIAQLVLTIVMPSDSNFVLASCSPILWQGMSITQSGVFTDTLLNASGCDSILRLQFTRLPNNIDTLNVSACSHYSWKGQTLTASGWYVDSLINQSGCDSLVYLNLRIHSADTVSQLITSCGSYQWNGQLITQSGNYSQTLVNQWGCDSLVQLNATILPVQRDTLHQSACVSFVWRGNTYSQSGFYADTLQNSVGCDSILVLDLQVQPLLNPSVVIQSLGSTVCQGDSIRLQAIPTLGGNAPLFAFFRNSILIQSGSNPLWSGVGMNAQDTFRVEMTANNSCQTTALANSSDLILSLQPKVQPSVSIVSSSSSACPLQSVTFTASANLGGSTPIFDFLKNGVSKQRGISSVWTSSFSSSDTVQVRLIANNVCQLQDSVLSNSLNIQFLPSTLVTQQALADTVNSGGNAQFVIAASGSSLSYQWQRNSGSGFANLSNGGGFSGVNTDTLRITGVLLSQNNELYRCVVSGSCGVDTSLSARLKVVYTACSLASNVIQDGAGVTANATIISLDNPGCLGASAKEAWFSFVASSTSVNIRVDASAGFDPIIQLFSGSCSGLSAVICNNGISNPYPGEILNTTNLVVGRQYFYRVYNAPGLNNGSSFVTTVSTQSTWNGSAWTGGAPSSSSSNVHFTVAKNPAPVLNGTVSMKDLTILPGMTISTGGALQLEVYGNVYNASSSTLSATVVMKGGNAHKMDWVPLMLNGKMIVESGNTLSSASSSLTLLEGSSLLAGLNTPGAGGAYTGNLQVRRKGQTDSLAYNLWSSPVLNNTVNKLLGSPLKYQRFNANTQAWVSISGAVTMQSGIGYVASGSPTLGVGGLGIREFSGTPNDGNIQPTLVQNPGTDDDWNLIGNPYPSGIEGQVFLSDNVANINGALYFWTVTNVPFGTGSTFFKGSDFSARNALSGNFNIGSAQGFFVEATSTQASFKNSQRTDANANFLRSSGSDIHAFLKIYNDSLEYNSTEIGFSSSATNGYDVNYDAKKLKGNPFISLYSRLNQKDFAIQTLGSLSGLTLVPLGVIANRNTPHHIVLDSIDNLPSGTDVFLIDSALNISHNLRTSGAYTFANPQADTLNNRFWLAFRPLGTQISPINEALNAKIWSNNTRIFIQKDAQWQLARIELMDVSGRTVHFWEKPESQTRIELETTLSPGIYVVRLSSAQGPIKTQRIYLGEAK